MTADAPSTDSAPELPSTRQANCTENRSPPNLANGGATSVIFNADEKSDAAYDITVDGYREVNNVLAGIIKNIVLRRCKPQAGTSSGPEPERIVVKPVDSHGSTMPGFGKDSQVYTDPLDCTSNMPSPHDVTQGVRRCGANAESTDARWPTANGDNAGVPSEPWDKYLALRPAQGATSSLHQHEPLHSPDGHRAGGRHALPSGGRRGMVQPRRRPSFRPSPLRLQGRIKPRRLATVMGDAHQRPRRHHAGSRTAGPSK